MHARFSPEIISELATAYPEATIQLVGPVWEHDDIKALRALPNVRFTGFIHHARIPAIMKGSDVLLLPHRVTQASCSMDPLKIYEYLAAGPPIVLHHGKPCSARLSRGCASAGSQTGCSSREPRGSRWPRSRSG